MADESKGGVSQEDAVLEASLMLSAGWKKIPTEQESIERERFDAYLCSRALNGQRQDSDRSGDAPPSDEIEQRLLGIEQKLDELTSMVKRSEDNTISMSTVWAVLSENGMELRLNKSDHGGFSTGDLVLVALTLPNDRRVVQLLTRVKKISNLEQEWITVQLAFEAIGEQDRDSIVRMAFQAQRLHRRTRS